MIKGEFVKQIRKRLTYANVMSSIAVFLVLGGAAFAAVKLPKNSVGTKQLKNNAVISAKVKDGSLLKGDFAAGQLPAGPAGPAGPKGDKGEKGDKGAQGNTGPEGPSTAYGAFHDELIELGTHTVASPLEVATLSGLPAGSYAIQAKLVADSESSSEDYTNCTLAAEGDSDSADDYLGTGATGDSYRAVFAMQVLHTFSGSGSATISCYHSDPTHLAFVKEIKITAIKLGSIAANSGV
jgi:hypothetical protein